jgi:L-seryl-tRNA(Ser) seleniumtransferase
VDKLTLAALEATLLGGQTPTWAAITADAGEVERRCRELVDRLAAAGVPAGAVPCRAAIGGGSAPDVTLPSWAVRLPERYAEPLRTGRPAVAGRVEDGHLLLDLRCVDPAQLDLLADLVLAVAARVATAG